jgi:hypothetical protein
MNFLQPVKYIQKKKVTSLVPAMSVVSWFAPDESFIMNYFACFWTISHPHKYISYFYHLIYI